MRIAAAAKKILVAPFLVAVVLLPLEARSATKPVLVTISKETTYITEPLRPDGYPDYLAALNQLASKGVTPEDNAVVILVQAFGPKLVDCVDDKPLSSEACAAFFQRVVGRVPALSVAWKLARVGDFCQTLSGARR